MTQLHSYQRREESKNPQEERIERTYDNSSSNYADHYHMRELRGMYKLSRPSNNGPLGVL